MLDAKEAARAAAEYFADLYASVDPTADPNSLRLEEVEVTENGRYWMITLSFRERFEQAFNPLGGGYRDRQYKVFKVDAKTGEVRSMKIRHVEGA